MTAFQGTVRFLLIIIGYVLEYRLSFHLIAPTSNVQHRTNEQSSIAWSFAARVGCRNVARSLQVTNKLLENAEVSNFSFVGHGTHICH